MSRVSQTEPLAVSVEPIRIIVCNKEKLLKKPCIEQHFRLHHDGKSQQSNTERKFVIV